MIVLSCIDLALPFVTIDFVVAVVDLEEVFCSRL